MRRAIVYLLAILVGITDANAVSGLPRPGDEYWDSRFFSGGLDGRVTALGTDGTNLYVGGALEFADDLRVNGIAKWDGTNWFALGSGIQWGDISKLIVRSNCVYISGRFRMEGHAVATNLAVWNRNSWEPMTEGLPSDAASITANDSGIYAGISVWEDSYGYKGHIFRWNDSTWLPIGDTPHGISILQGSGTRLVVGFSSTSTPARVAEWDGEHWIPLGEITGGSDYTYISALRLHEGELYVGGRFSSAGGVYSPHVAGWNGTNWFPLAEGLDDIVEDFAFKGSDVYLKGRFSYANRAFPRLNGAAKWNGTNWSPLGNGTGSYSVDGALVWHGNYLYAGGSFDSVIGRYLARWDGTNWAEVPGRKGFGLDGGVTAIASSGGAAYVCGTFSQAGSLAVTNMAKWTGSNWAAWGGLTNGRIDYIVAGRDHVYVAGQFNEIADAAVTNIAKWDGSQWSGLDVPRAGRIVAFTAESNCVYMATDWPSYPTSRNVYKWDGGTWTAIGLWGSDTSSPVRAILINGNDVYFGGRFRSVDGIGATNLVRWDGTNWWPVGGGVHGYGDSIVTALAFSGSSLVVAGGFTRAGTNTVSNIARWNGTTWFTFGQGLSSSPPTRMVANETEVFVAGHFALNLESDRVLGWNGSEWYRLGSGVGNPYYSAVTALSLDDDELFVGGGFDQAGEKPASSFSIWHLSRRLNVTRSGEGTRISWSSIGPRFSIERTENLTSPQWTDVGQIPQLEEGRYIITNSLQGSSSFFRLMRPD